MTTLKESASTVGDDITAGDGGWTFGGNTPKTFNEQVRKSVPYYLDGHDLTLALSNYFVQPDSVCYEIGSSTGALTRKQAEASSRDFSNLSYAHAGAADFEFQATDFIG